MAECYSDPIVIPIPGNWQMLDLENFWAAGTLDKQLISSIDDYV
jgi:hypothetical protein